MALCNAFNINADKKELISIVGGGGKTTLMFWLAKQLKELGKRVLVTTSTQIFYPNKEDYDTLVFLNDHVEIRTSPSITVIGSAVSEDGKLLGLSKDMIHKLYRSNRFDSIIVEADGSKRKPIKAPNRHEPVIPEETTKLIGVIGLDALGCSIDEQNVHRAAIFAEVTESQLGTIIDEKILTKLIIDKNGLFKDIPLHTEKILLLNKADDELRKMQAISICEALKKDKYPIDSMFVSSFKNQFLLEVT